MSVSAQLSCLRESFDACDAPTAVPAPVEMVGCGEERRETVAAVAEVVDTHDATISKYFSVLVLRDGGLHRVPDTRG